MTDTNVSITRIFIST